MHNGGWRSEVLTSGRCSAASWMIQMWTCHGELTRFSGFKIAEMFGSSPTRLVPKWSFRADQIELERCFGFFQFSFSLAFYYVFILERVFKVDKERDESEKSRETCRCSRNRRNPSSWGFLRAKSTVWRSTKTKKPTRKRSRRRRTKRRRKRISRASRARAHCWASAMKVFGLLLVYDCLMTSPHQAIA